MSTYTGFDQNIIERLTRMEEKQDHLLEKITGSTTQLDGHEVRLRSLETSGSRMLGMGAVVAAVAGFASPQLIHIITGR